MTRETKRRQKKFDDDILSKNCDVITIFPSYSQFGAIQKPDSGRIVCKTIFLTVTFYLTKTENRKKRTTSKRNPEKPKIFKNFVKNILSIQISYYMVWLWQADYVYYVFHRGKVLAVLTFHLFNYAFFYLHHWPSFQLRRGERYCIVLYAFSFDLAKA